MSVKYSLFFVFHNNTRVHSYYDAYRGVIVYFRVIDGKVKKGDRILFMASGKVSYFFFFFFYFSLSLSTTLVWMSFHLVKIAFHLQSLRTPIFLVCSLVSHVSQMLHQIPGLFRRWNRRSISKSNSSGWVICWWGSVLFLNIIFFFFVSLYFPVMPVFLNINYRWGTFLLL